MVAALPVIPVGHRPEAEVLPEPGQHRRIAGVAISCTLLPVRLPKRAAQLLWGWTLYHELTLLQHLIYQDHQGLGEVAAAPLLEGCISRGGRALLLV